jgi:hypothetical protein
LKNTAGQQVLSTFATGGCLLSPPTPYIDGVRKVSVITNKQEQNNQFAFHDINAWLS